jgi:Protein of unknown function (DUF4435)/AAA domain, putative AbiEii toxin, Type IV TA system
MINRWRGNPATTLLSDFEHLMEFLFSDEAEKNAEYKRQAAATMERVAPSETKLYAIKRIWESLLPTRELLIRGGKVETRVRASDGVYNGAEMSDGERVIFYLIGQALTTPQDGVLIVDEPECHVHRSLQARLWDEIEVERSDCLFIYLTHDLEFAASRRSATKVWLKEYDGKRWNWCVVPKEEGISEELLLCLIGSRKPILFVEGDSSSWDRCLYSRVYPEFTIIPCGNADGVVHATVTFQARKDLHALECRGLIDRDYRSDEQVEHLKKRHVYAAEVSEVENLFLVEAVFRVLAVDFMVDVETAVAKVKDLVFTEMNRERERVISALVASKIESRFTAFDAKVVGKDALVSSMQTLLSKIDVAGLYDAVAAQVDEVLRDRNYPAAIKVYNRKWLLDRVGSFLEYKGDFHARLDRLLSDKRGTPIIEAMRKALPTIPVA